MRKLEPLAGAEDLFLASALRLAEFVGHLLILIATNIKADYSLFFLCKLRFQLRLADDTLMLTDVPEGTFHLLEVEHAVLDVRSLEVGLSEIAPDEAVYNPKLVSPSVGLRLLRQLRQTLEGVREERADLVDHELDSITVFLCQRYGLSVFGVTRLAIDDEELYLFHSSVVIMLLMAMRSGTESSVRSLMRFHIPL